jgi:hypothetical protein
VSRKTVAGRAVLTVVEDAMDDSPPRSAPPEDEGAPRWVKVSAVVAVVFVVVLVIVHLAGGGMVGHTP